MSEAFFQPTGADRDREREETLRVLEQDEHEWEFHADRVDWALRDEDLRRRRFGHHRSPVRRRAA